MAGRGGWQTMLLTRSLDCSESNDVALSLLLHQIQTFISSPSVAAEAIRQQIVPLDYCGIRSFSTNQEMLSGAVILFEDLITGSMKSL